MARGRVWQGFLAWWRSPEVSVSPSRAVPLAGLRPAAAVAELSWSSAGLASSEGWRPHALALDPDPLGFAEEGEFSDAELREFMAGDLDPIEADPGFREQLRDQLWAMVKDGELGRRRDH